MSEINVSYLSELIQIIDRNTSREGVNETSINSLFFIRESNITDPKYRIYKPSLCIVVSGVKELLLGNESFKYGPGNFLVASVDLPVTGQVIEATPTTPYLALKIEFNPNQILEILTDTEIPTNSKENAKRAIFVNELEGSILDAVIRLARLIDSPEDIPILAPIFTKEILYRVLRGHNGSILQQIAIEGSTTNRIREVIEQIKANFYKSLRIEELAEIANMSVSSLHRHFKDVTAMSPLQFQKHLRLQEARLLLLSESSDAAEVAFRVGYESPSQFSREYSRLFGLPPKEDLKRLRAK
ncbi:AraC family transcriptional regulator [Bacillus sp. FJAT-25509]|uniref:AraC family transcriptional regulator n=1 Tax=Bacillus sp. FJAT-25509 TaxID=1712029 RepID=UPI0006F3E675|nr:AraC family transcriptional regulator [Bacillus sp. FJAT-25509]KQL41960.1 AraC family transcriptional regulator [Bacillus sp. FJAT-25509]